MSIFEAVVRGDLPEQDKSVDRLAEEATQIVAAGTDTTAWGRRFLLHQMNCPLIYFSKLSHRLLRILEAKDTLSAFPGIVRRDSRPKSAPALYIARKAALFNTFPTQRQVSIQLMLKYSAVISEGLRLGYGVCQRLPRVSPNTPIYFRSSDGKVWKMPAGTSMSMTSALVHTNPVIFPEPFEFRPERWIEDRRLDRYLISFSKGDRQCLGIKYVDHFLASLTRSFKPLLVRRYPKKI